MFLKNIKIEKTPNFPPSPTVTSSAVTSATTTSSAPPSTRPVVKFPGQQSPTASPPPSPQSSVDDDATACLWFRREPLEFVDFSLPATAPAGSRHYEFGDLSDLDDLFSMPDLLAP